MTNFMLDALLVLVIAVVLCAGSLATYKFIRTLCEWLDRDGEGW